MLTPGAEPPAGVQVEGDHDLPVRLTCWEGTVTLCTCALPIPPENTARFSHSQTMCLRSGSSSNSVPSHFAVPLASQGVGSMRTWLTADMRPQHMYDLTLSTV